MTGFFLEFLPNDQTCRDPTNQLEEKGEVTTGHVLPLSPAFHSVREVARCTALVGAGGGLG